MTSNSEPCSPVDAYKAIIDELVNETSVGVTERLIKEFGIYSKAPDDAAANSMVQSLTDEQRILLAEMFHQERTGAIHDVLAVLTWWLSCREVGFTFRGEIMPFELSGMGLHGDYIGRLDDWQWPEVGEAEGE